jgi:proteasome accessory factor C
LAVEVYTRLGQHIRLPVRIPQSVIDQLFPHLTPTDLAAADIAAGQVLAALEQAIAGRAAFPPWSGEALPVEESAPLIETALRDGLYLELDYYSAGRDELTHRLVEPYRLEWRGRAGAKADRPSGAPYLVGFCQRAQAERLFRVDRIRRIVLVPAPDD